jgi:anti-anti-sigma factor
VVIHAVVDGDTADVSLTGDLVANTATQLKEQLALLAQQGVVRIVLNLRNVNFMDSSGLNAFIEAHKQFLARGGRIILLAPTGAVSRVFKITGADRKFRIAATREQCLALLQEGKSPG